MNGIPFNQRVCLKGGTKAAKSGTCQSSDVPTGNFGLLRFDGMAGGDDIRELLAGTVNVCTNTAVWENGNKVGPVTQGIGTRFDKDINDTEYFEDNNNTQTYKNDSDAVPLPYHDGKIKGYRQVAVPVVANCNALPIQISRAACFLITQEAEQHGGSNEVFGELSEKCLAPGDFNPTNPVFGGPYDIILYKSSGSRDS